MQWSAFLGTLHSRPTIFTIYLIGNWRILLQYQVESWRMAIWFTNILGDKKYFFRNVNKHFDECDISRSSWYFDMEVSSYTTHVVHKWVIHLFFPRSSMQTYDNASLSHVNGWDDVENNKTPSYCWSFMYTINKCERYH